MRGWLGSSLASFLLTAAPAPGIAQEIAPGTFGERVDVEVVNVDVVVTDRAGRRVTDLARQEFELLVDGRPVAIEYFAAPPPSPDARGLAARPVEPLELAGRALPAEVLPSHLVVFVDQSALERRVRGETLDELRAYLAASPDPARQVMVAAFQDDLRLLAAPTGDLTAVEAALAALEQLPARATLIEAERTQLEMEIRNFGRAAPMARSEIDPAGDAQREVDRSQNERLRIQSEIELWAQQELDRQSRSLRALTQIVGALGAIEGRKSVVLATAGYTAEPAAFLLRFFAQKLGLSQGSQVTRVATLDELGIRLADDFERLVATAADARVAFYTVSPREPPPAQGSAEFGSAGAGLGGAVPPPKDSTAIDTGTSVVRLATATGGRNFYVDANLDERLGEVAADTRAVYSLGFTTSAAAGTGDHAIEVRLARDDLEARHRESFRRLKSAERGEASLVAAATLGTARNPFGLQLELGAAVPGAAKGEPAKVPIAVRIPLGAIALLPRGTAHEGRLQLQVAIQDAAGKLFFDVGTPIPLAIPAADLERALAGVWVHRAELALEPGRHRVAVLVTDEQAGEFSTASVPIEVPSP